MSSALATESVSRENKKVATKRIVLVGQPNVGKSCLFNALTGRYVTVSNFPGTTVDVTKGTGLVAGELCEIIDSPGIDSLLVRSDEERVTRSLLLDRPGAIVLVADSKNLPRALTLFLELSDLKLPQVLCLNMKDEALSRGCRLDAKKLSSLIGVPVAQTVAVTKEGLGDLREAIAKAQIPVVSTPWLSGLKEPLSQLKNLLGDAHGWLAPVLLQNHMPAEEIGQWINPKASQGVFELVQKLRRQFVRSPAMVLAETRQSYARELASQVWLAPRSADRNGKQISHALDSLGLWCLRPWPGYLIASLILWGVYQFVGVLAAQTAVKFLEDQVFGNWINPTVTALAQTLVPWKLAQDFLVGPYGIVTMALTYALALILPIVTAFFLALGFLEDSGYLPRLSVLANRALRLVGLNGKSIIPLILGIGCGTMAVLTTRILETKRERLIASFLLALAVPCSAQLGVIIAMSYGMAPWVLATWIMVVGGTFLTAGALAGKLLPGISSPLLIEIPPLRFPRWDNLASKVWVRLKWYLFEAVPLFIYGTAALFVLDATGALKIIEQSLSPIVHGWLGLPHEAAGALLVGFFRRDYGAAGLYYLQRQGMLNLRQGAVSLVTITLLLPCVAQFMVLIRERGIKAALAISGLVVGYALLASGILNRCLVFLGA
ncbi:MAG: ferrous iron transport protein B [Elusimicrobia bacterium]|nr:ferrous iron transport protein B [Elusimicrobiota bacterium]